jgi:integrase
MPALAPADPSLPASTESLSATAAAYARAALSPATRRAYRAHLRDFEAWCRARGLAPLPASPALVANHLAELAGRRAYSTLTARLAAIARAHHGLGLAFDSADPALRATLAGIARQHGRRPRRQAVALLPADILRIAGACGGDLRGLRDRALLLVGFAGAFRRSELVAIAVEHLRFSRAGVSIFLPRAKEDQEGSGQVVHIAANPLAAHCPVAALRRWLVAAGIREGCVFRRVDRNDRPGAGALSAEAVRLILRARAALAGYDAAALARLSPHSLRAGCITTLARAHVHERDIMAHSRHASASVMRSYIRAAATGEAFVTRALWQRWEE